MSTNAIDEHVAIPDTSNATNLVTAAAALGAALTPSDAPLSPDEWQRYLQSQKRGIHQRRATHKAERIRRRDGRRQRRSSS